jgi:hypothetical protein
MNNKIMISDEPKKPNRLRMTKWDLKSDSPKRAPIRGSRVAQLVLSRDNRHHNRSRFGLTLPRFRVHQTYAAFTPRSKSAGDR